MPGGTFYRVVKSQFASEIRPESRRASGTLPIHSIMNNLLDRIRSSSRALGVALLAAVWTGCGPAPNQTPAAGTPRATHHHDPRHGGTLVVLGDEEYHLELVHNRAEGLLQVYVFDGHIDNFVRLPDEGFDLLAWPEGRETRLSLKAVRSTPEGKPVTETALFEARAGWLRNATQFHARLPELTIRGRTFTDVEFEFPTGNLERAPE
jgi:hypothetical protein